MDWRSKLGIIPSLISFISISLFCLIPFWVHSQSIEPVVNEDNNTFTLSSAEVKADIVSGLLFLETEQRQETNGYAFYEGEWPNYICLKKPFKLKGKSKFYDSNNFGILPIHNSLATVFLLFPAYISIPSMLTKSMQQIMTYQTDSSKTFGFWHGMPPDIQLRKNRKNNSDSLIKRPNHFPLTTRIANNFVNVVDDADDQAQAIMAMLLYNRVSGSVELDFQPIVIPDSLQFIFEKYRDNGRKNILYYDLKHGTGYNTGAFLTWFGKEYDFIKPGGIAYYFNNYTCYFKISCLRSNGYDSHIPFKTNDVDVIVNANILVMLANFNLLETTKGVRESFELIHEKVVESDFESASLYYPNRYQLHLAVSRIVEAGAGRYLQNDVSLLISDLQSTQNHDGSWSVKNVKDNAETIQSTVNGLLALLNFGNFEANQTMPNIEKAMVFLHQNAIQEGSLKYWKGGKFFCGGLHIRNLVSWKSDCITTAFVLEAIAKYRSVSEHKDDASLPGN